MKVYFIGGGYDGCYYVRCLLPLIQNGWWGAKTSIRGNAESPQNMFKGAMDADIVVFQRPMQKEMLEAAKLLKQKGKKIVFDNDDTYRLDSGVPTQMFGIDKQRIDNRLVEIDKNLKEFASIADLVTTTTEFLANEYREYNKNVIVLPNMVDPDDWSKPIKNKTKQFRIGLIGSVAANRDYDSVLPALRELEKREDVKLVLFALPPDKSDTQLARSLYKTEIDFWDSVKIEWQPFVRMEDYFDTLNSLTLDLVLIPRHDNYFNRCKSNIKFLEASMLEIPVIAQGFSTGDSPYQDSLDSQHMGVVIDQADWLPTIESLIKDRKFAKWQGKQARKYVLSRYNIKKNANLWKEAYEKLLL